MLKYTDGKWIIRQVDGKTLVIENDNEQPIALLEINGANSIEEMINKAKELQANAYLIALAPELLSTCKDALESFADDTTEGYAKKILQQIVSRYENLVEEY